MKYINKDQFCPPKPEKSKFEDEDGKMDTVL